jgi:hypothetical protein
MITGCPELQRRCRGGVFPLGLLYCDQMHSSTRVPARRNRIEYEKVSEEAPPSVCWPLTLTLMLTRCVAYAWRGASSPLPLLLFTANLHFYIGLHGFRCICFFFQKEALCIFELIFIYCFFSTLQGPIHRFSHIPFLFLFRPPGQLCGIYILLTTVTLSCSGTFA